MRFNEFRVILTEGEKGRQYDIIVFKMPGYFSVGDSHSNGIGNYGRGKVWKALGEDGSSAFDPQHFKQIDKIPEGSVVAISAGANDFKKGTPNAAIVNQVNKLLDYAESKGLTVVYMLPTSASQGDDAHKQRREDFRKALRSGINVPIVDLGMAGPDGLHLLMPGYAVLANKIVRDYPIRKGVAGLGNPNAFAGAPTTKEKISTSEELVKGPPYPRDKKEEVEIMQDALKKLGYSLGRPGVDGKYGPFTAAAVAAFKKDYELGTDGNTFGKNEFAILDKIQQGLVAKVKRQTKSNTTQATEFDIPSLTTIEDVDSARRTAEDFLGRTMNDDEWKHLIQTTTAESSPNPKEMAQIAAVILNRTRSKYKGGNTVVDIVWQPGEFQPVTGFRKKDGGRTGPDKSFLTPVSQERLSKIIDAWNKYLKGSDKTFLNFSSANRKAYRTQSGLKFLDKLIAAGGITIGGTVFGTVT